MYKHQKIFHMNQFSPKLSNKTARAKRKKYTAVKNSSKLEKVREFHSVESNKCMCLATENQITNIIIFFVYIGINVLSWMVILR